MDKHLYKTSNTLRVCDGTGIHVCLRNIWGNPCRFKSDQTHQRVNKLINTGEKLVRVCLQRCVQYVCSGANTNNNKEGIMRSVYYDVGLRKKNILIHNRIISDYSCWYSLIIHKINLIHLWLVLHTTANIGTFCVQHNAQVD